jgi:hypothetical protein
MDTLLVRPSRASQEVKPIAKLLVGLLRLVLLTEFVVVSVRGDHLGVLHTSWNFDWTSKSVVVVALVIGDLLDFSLGQVHGVDDDRVMDRLGGGGSRIVVGDHEEVEEALAIVFDDTLVYNCARTWVANVTVGFFEESKRHLFINEDEEQFWIISLSKRLDSLSESTSRTFALENLLGHCWSSNTISVDDNLLWSRTFILLSEVVDCLEHELPKDFSSFICLNFLLLVF